MNELTTPMTESEARYLVMKIGVHLQHARAMLKELHDREGWKALGYETWRDCVASEFGQSQAYLYRQLAAAIIEANIDSPIGRNPERQLRELSGLNPVGQNIVYGASVQIATDNNGRLTAAGIKSARIIFEEIERTGAVDDGNGGQIPIDKAHISDYQAAIRQESYERGKRKESYIEENTGRIRAGKYVGSKSNVLQDLSQHLDETSEYHILVYRVIKQSEER